MQSLGGDVWWYLQALALVVLLLMMYGLVAEVSFLAVARRILRRLYTSPMSADQVHKDGDQLISTSLGVIP
jgi:hypothetical protein